MNEIERDDKGEGLEAARRMAEEEEGVVRRPKGPTKWVIPTIGVIWCFFQLSIASWWILDTVFIRAIHLGFAILIVYLNYPVFKETRLGLKFLSVKDRLPPWDFVVAIVACFSAVYIAVDYTGINERYGAPITRDLLIGLILLFLLLEATRRVIGPALSVIAGCRLLDGPARMSHSVEASVDASVLEESGGLGCFYAFGREVGLIIDARLFQRVNGILALA